MGSTDSAGASFRRGRRVSSENVTARAAVRYYRDGHYECKLVAADRCSLAEISRTLGGPASTAPPIEPAAAPSSLSFAGGDFVTSGGHESAGHAEPIDFLACRTDRAFNFQTPVRLMWPAYAEWAAARQLVPVSPHSFNQALRTAGLRYGRNRTASGKQQRIWFGVRLREVEPQLQLLEARHG